MTNHHKVWIALFVVFSLSGCVSSNVYQSTSALSPPINPSVLVLPADVEVSLMNAGGNLEPRADWSDAGRKGLYMALEEFFLRRVWRQSSMTVRHLPIRMSI